MFFFLLFSFSTPFVLLSRTGTVRRGDGRIQLAIRSLIMIIIIIISLDYRI